MGTRWARSGHRMGTKKAKLVSTILAFPLLTGAPGGSRTHDLWLRKPTLYPTELRARYQAGIIANQSVIFAVTFALG